MHKASKDGPYLLPLPTVSLTLTPPPTSSASATSVFYTVELLERILLDLPIPSISTARRVCIAWHRVIQASVALQRAQWLLPAKHVHELATGTRISSPACHQAHYYLSPLLGEALQVEDAVMNGVYVCLYLRLREGMALADVCGAEGKKPWGWRDMFAVQPVPRSLCMRVHEGGGEDAVTWVRWMAGMQRQRAGDLVDALKASEKGRKCFVFSDDGDAERDAEGDEEEEEEEEDDDEDDDEDYEEGRVKSS